MSFYSSTTNHSRLYATCTRGLEKSLQSELHQLGILHTEIGHSGLYLPYSMENVYVVNYCSRLATRLLLPLAHFPSSNREALYRGVSKVVWSQFLNPQKSFSVDVNVQETPSFSNSHFAALVVKDAICDQMRKQFHARPSIDVKRPSVQLNLYINRGKASLYFDTSGTPLFKRGWREKTIDAPMKETLAAALIACSDYTIDDVLFDPFCGSGTILVEAAMKASKTPAGFYRKWWGFFSLPDYSEKDWLRFKQEKDCQRQSLSANALFGVDCSQKALDSAYENLWRSGFDEATTLIARNIENLRYPIRPTVIITNPPYGVRLDANRHTLQALGRWISAQKARAFILYPEVAEFAQFLGIPCHPLLSCYNGGIKVSLFATQF